MKKTTCISFAKGITDEILSWSEKTFGLYPIEVRVICLFSSNERSLIRGFGESFVMVLYLKDYLTDGSVEFDEYNSFVADPEIGSVVGDWRKCLTALICHELAHIVDITRVILFLTGEKLNRLYPNEFRRLSLKKNLFRNRPRHNRSWKEIYRIIRREFSKEKQDEDILLLGSRQRQ